MAETKKAVATVKKVEAKAEKKVAAVKAVAEKKAAPVKEAVEKKATPVKKAVEKKAATVKAAAEKKAPAKKAAAKKVETKASLNVQFAGKDYKEADLIKMAKDAYKKAGNKDALKTINVYANIDDQVAYYVANGSIEGSFAI